MKNEVTKIAVIGSRDIQHIDYNKIGAVHGDWIISGGARGVDSLAETYAAQNGLSVLRFLPDYKSFGRGAPIVRNRQIVEAADRVVAFWDGKSRGTKYTIDYARKCGKPCEVVFS